jgi:hypothetical protein
LSTNNRLPDRETLLNGLAKVLDVRSVDGLVILERRKNIYTSSSNSEIVTCQLGDGQELDLFIKYGRLGEGEWDEFRGSVEFEVAVYRDVLQPLPLTTVKFYGTFTDHVSKYIWLVLAFLGGAYRLNRSPSAIKAIVWSARWLGKFHAAAQDRLTSGVISRLRTHTADYYLSWALRTLEFAGPVKNQYPWLTEICTAYEDVIPLLVSGPHTIIHGEYYPENILVDDARINPVDWQTTAMARGEIDLASLIERWEGEQLVRATIDEYCYARWQGVTPSDFSHTLTIAQLHWQFRWLGNKPSQTTSPDLRWRFEQLRIAGENAGLIS